MSVAEESELFEIVGLFESEHERDKSGGVERERNESMVGDERQEISEIASQQDAELLDETLAVQVVVGCD